MGPVDRQLSCCSCGIVQKIMKRCTRCRGVIYCSKECQIKDWPTHRRKCSVRAKFSQNEVDENHMMTNPAIMGTGIAKNETTEILKNEEVILPTRITVVVKCNHKKQKMDLMDVEAKPGTEIMKQFAERLHIPLSSLKVVGKGKLVHAENIKDMLIQNKCRTFQAFGEEAEDEDGLDIGDIEAIMERLHVGRNDAIRSLRSCNGDLIDAILELGNKM